MNRKIARRLFLSLVFMILLGAWNFPVEAKRVKYEKINCSEKTRTVKGTKFKFDYANGSGSWIITKNGETKVCISKKGLSSSCVTDGSTIYFSASSAGKVSVYVGNAKGEYDLLFSMNDDTLSLEGLYNNKLYFVRGIDPGEFCSYNLKTKKINVLDGNTTEVCNNGKYFYLNPYAGAPGMLPLKVYDASKGKKKTITKKMLAYTVSSGNIYMVECKKSNHSFSKTNIVKVNSNGSKRKVLLKNIEMQYPVKITNQYVEYVNKNGNTVKKKY